MSGKRKANDSPKTPPVQKSSIESKQPEVFGYAAWIIRWIIRHPWFMIAVLASCVIALVIAHFLAPSLICDAHRKFGWDCPGRTNEVEAVDFLSPYAIDLVPITVGEAFTMGSPTNDPCYDFDMKTEEYETSLRVKLTRGYSISRFEITQEQYAAVMGTNPSTEKQPKNPVNNVSWTDAGRFCSNLTVWAHKNKKLSGDQVFRLPTEAEWEYACRAGTTNRYFFGSDTNELPKYAWFKPNAKAANPIKQLNDVGQKLPNAWGLYDMLGNVSEWCYDNVAPNVKRDFTGWITPYENYVDRAGDTLGECRMARGGNYDSRHCHCGSPRRKVFQDGIANPQTGFRIVKAFPISK